MTHCSKAMTGIPNLLGTGAARATYGPDNW